MKVQFFCFSNYTEEEYGKERNPEKDYNARNLLLRLFTEAEKRRKMKIILPKIKLIYNFRGKNIHEEEKDLNPDELLFNYLNNIISYEFIKKKKLTLTLLKEIIISSIINFFNVMELELRIITLLVMCKNKI